MRTHSEGHQLIRIEEGTLPRGIIELRTLKVVLTADTFRNSLVDSNSDLLSAVCFVAENVIILYTIVASVIGMMIRVIRFHWNEAGLRDTWR